MQAAQLDLHDAVHIGAGEAVEDDLIVETVQELGPEMGAHGVHHVTLCFACIGPFGQMAERLGAEIGSQHDEGLFEIDLPALAIGQDAVIEDLQQDVEDLWMRLFDLVKQDHLIGPPADGFGQHAAFVIADIARRRADQTGDGVLFHEFRHVDAHHRLVVIKEVFRQRLGQFGLAHAGRPEEQEAAQRTAFVLQTGARTAHGAADGADRLMLTDDAFAKLVFHAQKFLAFAL